jgi:hypothetical protein
MGGSHDGYFEKRMIEILREIRMTGAIRMNSMLNYQDELAW